MQAAVARLMATNVLAEALERQDAVTGQRLVQTVLWER
jgi:hypothetical protein